jgi:hypothetical protein
MNTESEVDPLVKAVLNLDLVRAFIKEDKAAAARRYGLSSKKNWANPFCRAQMIAGMILASASQETHKRRSEAARKFYNSPEGLEIIKTTQQKKAKWLARNPGIQSGVNHPWFGRHHSEESKQKMREGRVGVPLTPEHRKAIIEACRKRELGTRSFITVEEAWEIKLELMDITDSIKKIARRWTERKGREMLGVIMNCNKGTYRKTDKEELTYPIRGYIHWNKGHPLPEATKAKLSASNKGKTAGEKNPKAKLTAADIPEIFRLSKSGLMIKTIAKQFGVRKETISSILRGKTWAHLGLGKLVGHSRLLTAADIPEIFRLHESGVTAKAIAEQFGISEEHTKGILCGRKWAHLGLANGNKP